MVTGVFELPKDLQFETMAASPEWFVAGVENWMLYEVFQVIAGERHDAKLSRRLSPIVIGGPSGSGKSLLTRLLADIWTRWGMPTRILSAADWVRACPWGPPRSRESHGESVVSGLPTSATRLVLDDIHQLSGNESAQRRLVTYLDALTAMGGIAAFTTQTSLDSGLPLTPALISRLRGGISIQLSLPDQPSRWIIIHKLARQLGWTLDDDAVKAVDRSLPAEPRLISGRLRQLLPQRPFEAIPLTIRDIELRLGGVAKHAAVTPDQIISAVARHLQLPARVIRSQSRRKNVVQGRSVAIYLIRKLTNLPLKEIGASFSNRDHATILHAIQKIEHALPDDVQLTRLIDELQLLLQTGAATMDVSSP